jgi:hypothetical protein
VDATPFCISQQKHEAVNLKGAIAQKGHRNAMPIKPVGSGQFFSSRTNRVYESETMARKYDDEAGLESKAQERGEEILDALSTEDLKSVLLRINGRLDDRNAVADATKDMIQFIEDHPEFADTRENGKALRTYLRSKGYEQFNRELIEQAYEDLSELGEMQLTGKPAVKKEPAKKADDDDGYVSPLNHTVNHTLRS